MSLGGMRPREKPKVGLSFARMRAEGLREKLAPYVERVEIVGSIRRENPMVGDIELLLEPPLRESTFFGDREPVIEPIRRTLWRFGRLGPNGDRYIKCTNREESACPVDVFLVHPPATWGAQQAIRTGPASLSRHCVTQLRHKGWRCKAGRVLRPIPSPPAPAEAHAVLGGRPYEQVPTETEEAFFEACGVPCVPPNERDELARRLYVGAPHRGNGKDPEFPTLDVRTVTLGFVPLELGLIQLQTFFENAGDRADVLKILGNVKDEAVRTQADDGVSQTVTARSGVALVEEVPVPRVVYLVPFRTFPEVEQPASPFVLRLQKGQAGIEVALLPADNGLWELEAIASIGAWLADRLEGTGTFILA